MSITDQIKERGPEGRQAEIVEVFVDAFGDMIGADADAMRRKFRKMADNPFAFYRGSACLFYHDMARADDRWADERTSRIWIQGDLHAENFGTYMDSAGTLVFDVNDFDEAYLGAFTWDLKRFCASIALISWRKAISDADIEALIATYVRAYVRQVRSFVASTRDEEFKLHLDNTDGPLHEVLLEARMNTRIGLLNGMTTVEDYERRFTHGKGVRELGEQERALASKAFERYLETIPANKRFGSSITYQVKGIVGRKGFGIGSAGLPAYNILVEGHTEALENDVVLSMKQGNIAAPSRIVHDERIRDYFQHHGHRTAVSQRALQAHADPWLGHTELDGVGFVVSELSPYVSDLDWSDLTEPDEIQHVLEYLGQATAGMHCVSDADSEQTLVDFQSEEAIVAAIGSAEDEFISDMVRFGMSYARQTRQDRQLFVDAFRNGQIPGVQASTPLS